MLFVQEVYPPPPGPCYTCLKLLNEIPARGLKLNGDDLNYMVMTRTRDGYSVILLYQHSVLCRIRVYLAEVKSVHWCTCDGISVHLCTCTSVYLYVCVVAYTGVFTILAVLSKISLLQVWRL